jgi:PAS domain S-box-containing protein
MKGWLIDMDMSTTPILSSEQKEQIFENMSDGIMTVNNQGQITYMNSSCEKIFAVSLEELKDKSFEEQFLGSKKNRAFNKLFLNTINKNAVTKKTTVKYEHDGTVQYFTLDISLIQADDSVLSRYDAFPGMIILFDDVTEQYQLTQHKHDCAYIFAGLILCISLYLSIWSLLEFTLKLSLKNSFYTLMIEAMTFLLFLEVLFFTSLSLRDVGLIPKRSTIKQHLTETLCLMLGGSLFLIFLKLILTLLGYQIKSRFIGGSLHGAYIYLFTAFIQEFLARGVIQTSVKSLMQVKYQKAFSILLTSLLFSLMHLPFGFIFMLGAFFLSLILGYLYERHENLWGCALLHWSCGYLAMCLFF